MTASDDTPVTTGIITVSPATYARAAMMRLAGRWWWIVVLPLATFLILSAVNPAFIMVAMMWIFMLLPPAVLFAYYSYLLQPAAASMAHPHTITVDCDGTVIIHFVPVDGDDPRHVPQPVQLAATSLDDVNERKDHLELIYHDHRISLVLIPYSSLDDTPVIGLLTRLSSPSSAT